MNRFHIEVNMVLFFIPFFRVAPDGWKGECFMIWQFVGSVLWKVLKAVAWLVLATLRCVLELAKLALLVFGLVARVFLIFAKAAVPD